MVLSTVSSAAYPLLNDRVEANQGAFFVYQDGDSGLNHGFASGKFASNNDSTIINGIGVNTAAVYEPNAASGTSSDPNALDRVRGNVLQVTFPKLASGQFAGLNIEEPESYGANPRGLGYDLGGATQVVFDAASPTAGGLRVQFGVGGKVTDQNNFYLLTGTFSTISIPLSTLRDPATNAVFPPDLSSVHILFSAATNNVNAPGGGTVLLDNIRFEPMPASHAGVPSFPLDTQTFGVVPVISGPVNQAIPPDQANRNLSTIYATSLTALSLLNRGGPKDLTNAREVVDALVYALQHDIKGDGMPGHGAPIPTTPDGLSVGLHSGYSSGDLPLLNDQFDFKTQQFDRGLRGQTRLAGFTGPPIPPNATPDFYLVLDGATGGNNAFAILALTAAYRRFADTRYLDASREIGRWIAANLADTNGTGYGGYYVGYRDGSFPKQLQLGKSVENNADIFAAFTELAAIESDVGNTSESADWTVRANAAGDFVMAMYDATAGRFNAGTLPANTNPGAGPGFDPSGPQKGNDIINKFDFLDSDSFTTLAMASSPHYRGQIDWHRPVQYLVDHFAQMITAGGQTFQGFDIVTQPTVTPGDNRTTPGPNGIAWEFTGQAIETMRFVDALFGDTRFATKADFYLEQIAHAQLSAPFADGRGLVAATVQDGDQLAPLNQGLTTPFQFIPERVGLPATTWAILADEASNLFAPRFVAPPLPDAADTFVQALYSDFLGRPAGAAEVLGWRQVLVNGGSTPVAAGVVGSHEAFIRLVGSSDGLYSYFLNRLPGPGEVAGWVEQLEHHGLNEEGLIVDFVTSQEFTATHASDDSFIRSLGSLLLCRTLRDSEVGSLLAVLSMIGRSGLTTMVLASTEYRSDVVQTLYGKRPIPSCLTFVPILLHRAAAPAAGEVASQVNSGLDTLGMEIGIASSLEYFRHGVVGANPNFIASVYRDELLRPAASAELDAWTSLFVAAGSEPVVNGIVRSGEARKHLVASWYGRYLARSPLNGEEKGWVDMLLKGASEEQVLSGILATEEFFSRSQRLELSGAPNERFVQALYQLLLERLASAAEVNGWLNLLSGAGRQAVALAITSSAELRGIAVQNYYSGLLHRTASPKEVTSWVNSPLDLTTIQAGIESSLEFNLDG